MEREPGEKTQDEVTEQAEGEGDDPQTGREERELDLMDDDDSEAGENIGDETP